MSSPELYSADIQSLIRREVDRAFRQSFGGSPGVYTNLTATVDRTGRIKFARGGGEVAINWDRPGTVYYVAPYDMVMATAGAASSSGTAAWAYAVSAGGTASFSGTALPFRLRRDDVLRIAASGFPLGGYAAVTLVRDLAGTVEGGTVWGGTA